jgi:hypothetical protein
MYDLDPLQAGETRVKVLGMPSKERMALFGGHFAWPGVGNVGEEKEGFRYFPDASKWVSK